MHAKYSLLSYCLVAETKEVRKSEKIVRRIGLKVFKNPDFSQRLESFRRYRETIAEMMRVIVRLFKIWRIRITSLFARFCMIYKTD